MNNDYPNFAAITRKASKTFFLSSLLFPKEIRNDIYILYSFLRVSDDMVDVNPPNVERYTKFKEETQRAFENDHVDNAIINAFVSLVRKRDLDPKLVWDYFRSQDIDLATRSYATYHDLLTFVYGVAEVVGLYMAQIMDLPREAYGYARLLGRAMQLVNILRDINEDARVGKSYLPQDELAHFHLPAALSADVLIQNRKNFEDFMHFQLDRAYKLIEESEKGFSFFPKKYLLPIKISAHLYKLVISKILAKPAIVFQKKVRPNHLEIIVTIFRCVLVK